MAWLHGDWSPPLSLDLQHSNIDTSGYNISNQRLHIYWLGGCKAVHHDKVAVKCSTWEFKYVLCTSEASRLFWSESITSRCSSSLASNAIFSSSRARCCTMIRNNLGDSCKEMCKWQKRDATNFGSEKVSGSQAWIINHASRSDNLSYHQDHTSSKVVPLCGSWFTFSSSLSKAFSFPLAVPCSMSFSIDSILNLCTTSEAYMSCKKKGGVL